MASLRSAAVVDIDRDLTSPQFLDQVRWLGTPECVAQLSVCPSDLITDSAARAGTPKKTPRAPTSSDIFFDADD